MSNFIRIQKISKVFQIGQETLHVLKDISLDIRQQEMLSIVGASGAGKSTLMHLLGALDRPSGGSIFYGEQDIFNLGDAELAKFRNTSIGFVFQFHHLLPEFTAAENVMMPLFIHGLNRTDALKKAETALHDVGLQARMQHKPGELSGGEQERVAIARAIVNEPAVVLADEPTGNLDTKTGEAVSAVLHRLNQEKGMVIVLVTHNEQLAQTADRTVHLSDGEIEKIED
jgi:lipoprotein-releasing system ATP-binding protein